MLESGYAERALVTCHKFKTFQYSQYFSNAKDRKCGNLKKFSKCIPQGELSPSSHSWLLAYSKGNLSYLKNVDH